MNTKTDANNLTLATTTVFGHRPGRTINHTQNSSMRIVLCYLVLALFFQACSPSATKQVANAANAEAQAQQLIVAGNYLAAADEYTRLARLYPEQAVFYQLRTADSLIRAGDTEQATDILQYVETGEFDDKLYKTILLSRIALIKNQAQSALSLLSTPPKPGTPEDLKIAWHRTKSKAYELAINFINAVEQRIQLDRFLLDPGERQTNIQSIWEDLNRIKLPVLRELRSTGSESIRAWMELAIINQTMLFKPGVLEQALNSWIEQYPDHAATPTITREILALSNKAVLKPQHIAILLPLTGQYENAAHAIRDGFLAAWYSEQDDKPRISIYSATALNIERVYRQAVSDGADFIVGPLEKRAVDTLLQSATAKVTTLALNHGEQVNSESHQSGAQQIPLLIQFGLSPEDEARQAAEKAIFDGHNKALVITPNNNWGLRLAEAFGETWNALGGKVLEYVSYDQRSRDYSTPVKKLLNIDSSQLRASKLRRKLNRSLKSEPRLREDADMIFMAAFPLSARQIVPQFRFYLATNIPVYSSSHAYSGIENRQADSDMNGILFTDMPALLEPERMSSPINLTLKRNWSTDTSNYRRLYALGVDAYRIIPNIGKLSLQNTAVYHGETGDLYMTDSGRIQRKLLWARFVNGLPSLSR